MFRAVKAVSRTFRPEPGQIAAARQFAHAVLDEWGFVSDDAVLVVSELATNATVHAQSPFSVSLQGDAQQLLVEVADASPRLPTVLDTPATALHGRGLAIVARLARAWGTRVTDSAGKVVWAELDSDVSAPARAGHGELS